MKKLISALLICALLMAACRSTRQTSTTQSSTTSTCTLSIDSAAQSILNTRKKTTTITFLPMQTPGQLNSAPPDNPTGPTPAPQQLPAPLQDIANALMEQGGGTIIITQEEQLQNDTTTIIHRTDEKTTQATSESHETQSQSNPPRASPIINKLFYLFLMSFILILLWESRNHQ